jgi:hypothetical protein
MLEKNKLYVAIQNTGLDDELAHESGFDTNYSLRTAIIGNEQHIVS